MVMVDYLLVDGLLVLLVGLILLASSCSTLREILSMIEIIKRNYRNMTISNNSFVKLSLYNMSHLQHSPMDPNHRAKLGLHCLTIANTKINGIALGTNKFSPFKGMVKFPNF